MEKKSSDSKRPSCSTSITERRALNILYDRTGYSVFRAIRQNNEPGGINQSRRCYTGQPA